MLICQSGGATLLMVCGTLFTGSILFGQSDPAKPATKKEPDTSWLNDVTRVPPGENRKLGVSLLRIWAQLE